MPKVSRPPRNIDTSVYLYDWLSKLLVLPDSASSFKPAYNFKEGRLLKILSVERRLKEDGSYRTKDGLRVVVCDANHRVFAVLTPASINHYEQSERVRVTKNLINTEIFVTSLRVRFLSARKANQLYGYSDSTVQAILGQNTNSLLAELPAYAVVQIENFNIGNRDRYIPQNVDAIPYLYLLPRYQERYFAFVEDSKLKNTYPGQRLGDDIDEIRSQ